MKAKILAIAAAVAFTALASPPVAQSATFDLHLRPYCETDDCGHSTRAQFETFVCRAVEELNLEYSAAGVSFRPTIAANQTGTPNGGVPGLPADKNQYSELDVGEACKDETSDDGVLAEAWRANIAAANPNEISYLLRPNWDWNCSRFPWFSQPYGIIGDAAMSRGVQTTGAVFAHEIGHYFALLHTFSRQDPATHNPVVHDGDVGDASHALVFVIDTPDDADSLETCPRYCNGDPTAASCTTGADCMGSTMCIRVCTPHHDEDVNGNFVDGHNWVGITENPGVADPGSPHPDSCTPTFFQQSNGQTIATVPAATQTYNSMSYWGSDCVGPIIIGGQTLEPFSADQIARMSDSRQVYANRNANTLPDVCASRGGDSDQDGICDFDDSCRYVSNLCTQDLDSDGDTIPDGCDNCPSTPNQTQDDLDDDGDGDACDIDDDDDGCYDEPGRIPQDQHPKSAYAQVGTYFFSPHCTGNPNPIKMGFEGGNIDTDDDGVPDCADYDDDNDGLCDDAETLTSSAPGVGPKGCTGPDVCRLIPGRPGHGCMEFVDCPGQVWWDVCMFGGCDELLLKFKSLINPDPTSDLVLDQFEVVNQTIYAQPASGLTASQSAATIGALAGLATQVEEQASSKALGTVAAVGGADERFRAEIWRRSASGEETLVRVVGEFDAASLRLGDVTDGRIVRLSSIVNPRSGRQTLTVGTTHTVGLESDVRLPDSDRDGVPDLVDNCARNANLSQRDEDGDGYGDHCDPDLNNDGKVTAEDLRHVESCLGADLQIQMPRLCATEGVETEPFVPAESLVALAQWCKSADLSGDGQVNAVDHHLVLDRLGTEMELGPGRVDAADPVPAPGCVGPSVLQKAKLTLRGLQRSPGQHSMKISGQAVLPSSSGTPVDPASNGLRIRVRTANGRDVFDTVVPAGDFDPASGEGWLRRGRRRMIYTSRDSADGIGKVVLRDAGEYFKIRVVSKKSSLSVSPGELPLSVELTFDTKAAATGQCARALFGPTNEKTACRATANGSNVACR